MIDKEEIKEARKTAKLTQSKAAALVYKSLNMWQKYEAGDRPIPLEVWELFNIKLIAIKDGKFEITEDYTIVNIIEDWL